MPPAAWAVEWAAWAAWTTKPPANSLAKQSTTAGSRKGPAVLLLQPKVYLAFIALIFGLPRSRSGRSRPSGNRAPRSIPR